MAALENLMASYLKLKYCKLSLMLRKRTKIQTRVNVPSKVKKRQTLMRMTIISTTCLRQKISPQRSQEPP